MPLINILHSEAASGLKKMMRGKLSSWYFLQLIKMVLDSTAPLDILLKLHFKYVENAKILINKTMSDISTEFGANHCVIMLTMHGTYKASVW